MKRSGINLQPLVSRRLLGVAIEHVRRKGGEASGPDGRTWDDLFDGKRRSQTRHDLLRCREDYHFGGVRAAKIFDKVSGKERKLSMPNITDRIMLHAIVLAAGERAKRASVSEGVGVNVAARAGTPGAV
jgi:hypothetical protein